MRILITAGPTREYLDAVRFLSNASSGRMGYAIAEAAVAAGHQVVLVSGPVGLTPPAGCEVHQVETSGEMYDCCHGLFVDCDGIIATAAVCDYRPRVKAPGKLSKTGKPLLVEFVETADVLAELGRQKEHRWAVGFALEADDARYNAIRKLYHKRCDAIVLNAPAAIGADSNSVTLIDKTGATVANWEGLKADLARQLIEWIGAHLSAG